MSAKDDRRNPSPSAVNKSAALGAPDIPLAGAATRSNFVVTNNLAAKRARRRTTGSFATSGVTRLVSTEPSAQRPQRISDGIALHARYFDCCLLDAIAAGIRQAVLFSSAQEMRICRLNWPRGMSIYQIDHRHLAVSKTAVLARVGAGSVLRQRTVRIATLHDWPSAIQAAGFDTANVAAWCADGVHDAMNPESAFQVFETISQLARPGSTIAMDSRPGHRRLSTTTTPPVLDETGRAFDRHRVCFPVAAEQHPVTKQLDDVRWRIDRLAVFELITPYGSDLVARYGIDRLNEGAYCEVFSNVVCSSATRV